MRSLMLPPGFKNSAFARISHPVASDSDLMRTRGVLPMHPSTPSLTSGVHLHCRHVQCHASDLEALAAKRRLIIPYLTNFKGFCSHGSHVRTLTRPASCEPMNTHTAHVASTATPSSTPTVNCMLKYAYPCSCVTAAYFAAPIEQRTRNAARRHRAT